MSNNVTSRLDSDLRALERDHREMLADLDEIEAATSENLTAEDLRRLMTVLINMNRRTLDLLVPVIEAGKGEPSVHHRKAAARAGRTARRGEGRRSRRGGHADEAGNGDEEQDHRPRAEI